MAAEDMRMESQDCISLPPKVIGNPSGVLQKINLTRLVTLSDGTGTIHHSSPLPISNSDEPSIVPTHDSSNI